MKFPKAWLLAVVNSENVQSGEPDYEVIKQGRWEHDSPKYEGRTTIFQTGEKFYTIHETRSGSPFTDWHYDSEDWDAEVECDQVRKVQVISEEWAVVSGPTADDESELDSQLEEARGHFFQTVLKLSNTPKGRRKALKELRQILIELQDVLQQTDEETPVLDASRALESGIARLEGSVFES